MTPLPNPFDSPPSAVKTLNTCGFSQERFAVEALRNEGFALIPDTVDIWRSADGLIDAVVQAALPRWPVLHRPLCLTPLDIDLSPAPQGHRA